MKFSTTKDELSIELHGREQLWALRARVRINKKDIKSIKYQKNFKDWRKWEVRMPGASIPGHLVAGSYWTEEGWDFIYITDPRGLYKPLADNVLVVETKLDRYKRIIVSMPAKEANKIVSWFKPAKG